MDLKEYIFGFLLVGLFTVSIFSFISGITLQNKPIAGLDTSGIDITGLTANLDNSSDTANSNLESFTKDIPVLGFGSLVFFSIWGVAKIIVNSIIVIFNIIIGGISSILGIPPIVTGTISSILLIGLIFAVWKMIKTGQ